MSKTELFDDLGRVTYRRFKKAKKYSIHVKPFQGIIVTLPYRASFESARQIMLDHRPWLLKKLAATRSAEAAVSLDLSEGKLVITRRHVLRATACDIESASWTLKDGALTIFYPETGTLADPSTQTAVRSGLVAAYRAEAKLLLPARVAYWAEHFGFTYSHVVIKNMRSRWGSCSGKNIINLNLHLMRLNDSLIDYVILHELVHTKIKNHGDGFWRQLHSLVGNSKELDAQLKSHSIAFF
jgi:predicted metal-dependent hydrolase